MTRPSPITPFLDKQGLLLLDGGLATELENQGFVLDTALWSAHLLLDHPDAIRTVHRAYLDAGADCITTASYQAGMAGLRAYGLSEQEARDLLQRSVTLAVEAREAYLDDSTDSDAKRLRPLVAASIGPYGASLANGAEYRGNYGLSADELRAFHTPRWEILASAPVDLLACETIPSYEEAEVLLALLQQTPEVYAWVSFSCRDGAHISDGTPIRACAALFEACEQVVAVGVNCTSPDYIPSLIAQVCAGAPGKPVVAYPNAGEVYDGTTRTWVGTSDPMDCGLAARAWVSRGARLIGGCCRLGPEHISAMRHALL